MILATINRARQLLYLTYIGRVGVSEVERWQGEITALLDDLSPGFRLLVDLERLDSMDVKAVASVGKVMELLDQRGLSLSVRVIPDPSKDIGLNILTQFHYRRQIRVVTCQTMTEALAALEL